MNVSIILLALDPSALDLLVSEGDKDDPTASSGAIEGTISISEVGQ